MCVSVGRNFEERMIQEFAILGGIGIESLAQHEECCRHFKSLVDLDDLTACRETVR